jgi:hypothetical protein
MATVIGVPDMPRLTIVVVCAVLDLWFLWTIHRAIRTGSVDAKIGSFTRDEQPVRYWGVVAAQVLLGVVILPALILDFARG